MADDNKNIPPSAGEAAKAIASDEATKTEGIQDVDREKYEKVKLTPAPVDGGKKAKAGAGAGWKIATLVFALVALGASGYCFYLATTKNGGTYHDKQANCVDNGNSGNSQSKENNNTNGTNAGNIAENPTSGTVISFHRSGLKLTLSDDIEFVNTLYDTFPNDGYNFEKVYIGGLTKNTYGAQSFPAFASGSAPLIDGGSIRGENEKWVPLAILTVYTRNNWDNSQNSDNGSVGYGTVVYQSEEYVVTYQHPQTTYSEQEWEKTWELATAEALENSIKNESNWSK